MAADPSKETGGNDASSAAPAPTSSSDAAPVAVKESSSGAAAATPAAPASTSAPPEVSDPPGATSNETGWGDVEAVETVPTLDVGASDTWTAPAPTPSIPAPSAAPQPSTSTRGGRGGRGGGAAAVLRGGGVTRGTPRTARAPSTTTTSTSNGQAPASTEGANGTGGEQAAVAPQNGDGAVVANGETPAEGQQDVKERKPRTQPYINPNRVDTGGLRKAKLTPEELTERMAAARLKNEQLLAKRQAVDADEADWRDQEAETLKAKEEEKAAREAKAQRLREVQQSVDDVRARNAARKLEKAGNRNWDSDKKEDDFDPKHGRKAVVRSDDADAEEDLSRYMVQPSYPSRGGDRGRGRGRGGPRGGRATSAGGGSWGASHVPATEKTPGKLNDTTEYPALS